MKPRAAADNPMPPWPQAKVELASYTAIPGEPVTPREKQLLDKLAVIYGLAQQAITYLTTDAYGTPREPSQNEREAIEVVHRIQEESCP